MQCCRPVFAVQVVGPHVDATRQAACLTFTGSCVLLWPTGDLAAPGPAEHHAPGHLKRPAAHGPAADHIRGVSVLVGLWLCRLAPQLPARLGSGVARQSAAGLRWCWVRFVLHARKFSSWQTIIPEPGVPSLCSLMTSLLPRSAPGVERPGSPTLYHPLYGAAAAPVDEDEYDSDDPDNPPDPRRVRAAWEVLQASSAQRNASCRVSISCWTVPYVFLNCRYGVALQQRRLWSQHCDSATSAKSVSAKC